MRLWRWILRVATMARLPHPRKPVTPIPMATDPKPQGPASYFPSIEKKYGHPIAHWLALADAKTGLKHMELVAWLKAEHGLGHGHANAIVAHVLASRNPGR